MGWMILTEYASLLTRKTGLSTVIVHNGNTDMSTMILMVGIQGSGKSEFCRQYLANKYDRVNLDTLKTRNNEQRIVDLE